MNDRISNLYIENFRILAEGNTFNFKSLNIYTGANNSGKSTVFKAIRLFSEGISRSDFPALNLITEEYNLGSFKEVKNINSANQYFKFGYNIQLPNIEEYFKVLYTFVDGSKEDFRFLESAIFESMEIINSDGEVFFGIYRSTGLAERESTKIEFPSDKGDTSIIRFRLSIELLRKFIEKIADVDYRDLLVHLGRISYEDGYWWGECFSENEYCLIDYDVSPFSFHDFEQELLYDYFFNLASYSLKEALYSGESSDLERENYQLLVDDLHYQSFIHEVLRPILEAVKFESVVFNSVNVQHIQPDLLQERLILKDHGNDYLLILYRLLPEYLAFVRESLAMFDIDGVIEIIPHLNSAFEVNLITGVKKILKERKNLSNFSFEPGYDSYITNPRINIAELGKGTSNLIKLILKTLSVLISSEEEKVIRERIPNEQGRKKSRIIKKTILVEEPEVFLHPSWQSKLVDFFTLCLNKFDVQFIIETHSAYLIQRLQSLVAKGQFDPHSACILYFNSVNEADKYYEITIRKDGILKERFGTGFYDQAAIMTADILNANSVN